MLLSVYAMPKAPEKMDKLGFSLLFAVYTFYGSVFSALISLFL
jgi:hypothetical protein